MTPLHTDTRLVSRIQGVHFEYVRARLEVVRRVSGDADSVRYYEAEHLQACLAPGSPNPLFNQILLSGAGKESDLAGVLDAFERAGVTPRLEMGPGAIGNELAVQLTRRGFLYTHADPVLILDARGAEQRPESGIEVTRVQSAEAFDRFISTYLQALRVAPEHAPLQRRYMEHWQHLPGWAFYLASRDGAAMGIGVLFSRGDVSYLAEGATIPEFRARGAQTALIAQRLADAQQRSARLVFSRAQFGSSSQRNLERAGLESRYTLSICTKDATSPGDRPLGCGGDAECAGQARTSHS